MRKIFSGFMVASLLCGVALAQNAGTQNANRENQGVQPGAAGQKQAEASLQGNNPQANQGQQSLQQGQQRQGQQVTPQNQFGQQGQPRQQLQQGQPASADQQIAACLHGQCKNEIEISKFAESKAQSQEVRDFAKQMVTDHTPGCEELQRMAGDLASRTANRPSGESAGQSAGGLDWVSIHRQVGEQCLASVKQALSKKSGAEFDQCFLGQQIGSHMMMVDELKVVRNYVSSDFAQKLDKELETAERHLQLAMRLEEKMKDSPSPRAARNK